jgi:hypothetical protein
LKTPAQLPSCVTPTRAEHSPIRLELYIEQDRLVCYGEGIRGCFLNNKEALVMLRSQLADIIFGSAFLLIGLTAFAIAGISRRRGTRIFAWLGIWSAL